LLDNGHYYGSVRTMYRLLAAQNQAGDRRRQRRHPVYAKPELLAVRPKEVWSWHISKLRGPAKWTHFNLCVTLDIFSRYVVGWMVAHRETVALAEQLIADSFTVAGYWSIASAGVMSPRATARLMPAYVLPLSDRVRDHRIAV
jgi:transposase InsO family protein